MPGIIDNLEIKIISDSTKAMAKIKKTWTTTTSINLRSGASPLKKS